MSSLKYLSFSSNTLLTFNFSSDWVPPFQLDFIYLSSCKLGPHFPKWLQTQKNLSELDISSNGILDNVPSWFWDLSPGLRFLNLSNNLIEGLLPNLSLKYQGYLVIDLSSNHFSGPIPLAPPNGYRAHLSDLSDNSLSGELPSCWVHLKALSIIKLAHNNLYGKIPSSMGSLGQIQTLHLRNNNFSGEIPSSLKRCTNLIMIDLGGNKLTGKIPAWIGAHLTSLIVLSLRFNDYIENALVLWKGQEWEYRNTLGLLKSIDLSDNNLAGKIPKQVGSLAGLVSLNLSRNNLTGNIIQEVGKMKMLDSLDLSANELSGAIPTGLADLNFLSVLNLSNNRLSGKIPIGTQLQSFDPSVYSGNPELCGLPLPNKCPGEIVVEPPVLVRGKDERIQEDDNKFITTGFYVSIGLGFTFGFWTVFGTMIFNKPSRHAYFKFLDFIKNYVTTALRKARLGRRLQRSILQAIFSSLLPRSIYMEARLHLRETQASSSELAAPTVTSVLNLSNNKLSRKIPTSTQLQSFDASAYSGNPELCELPLPNKCRGDEIVVKFHGKDKRIEEEDNEDKFLILGFYVSLGLGFTFGFWAVLGHYDF
ncbi:hypothetical protein ACSBR2_007097 [Camellia fascicularis]